LYNKQHDEHDWGYITVKYFASNKPSQPNSSVNAPYATIAASSEMK